MCLIDRLANSCIAVIELLYNITYCIQRCKNQYKLNKFSKDFHIICVFLEDFGKKNQFTVIIQFIHDGNLDNVTFCYGSFIVFKFNK